mmetsp:Transcript_24372/g.30642  ORF Transcript_24372/g.30642 Transcript_24372/m.30642 type:complete len:402 (+) Transcript_24372:64-1269(+)
MKLVLTLGILVALQVSCSDAEERLLKGSKRKKKNKKGKNKKIKLKEIPIDEEEEWGEPDWLKIIEGAFPPWEVDGPCASLTAVGETTFDVPPPKVVGSQEGKFNPCYYTKRFAGLDPTLGGYPTPIDTKYPYEFASGFFGQPGDGSVHHCPLTDSVDPNTYDVGSCPKLGHTCGKDCAVISDDYGIGHIPPFVPLAAVKMAYNSGEYDVCADWFSDQSLCNIKKEALDDIVYKYFGDGSTIKFTPPILIDDKPSPTYYKLEYIGDPSAGPKSESKGPHYCVKGATNVWGDFCPYIETGPNTGKYRHPHLALAAFELWIANQCMPEICPLKWLDSPNGQGYASDPTKASNIVWCEMEDNDDDMGQPKLPYTWPITDSFGLDLYDGKFIKPVKGSYVTELINS